MTRFRHDLILRMIKLLDARLQKAFCQNIFYVYTFVGILRKSLLKILHTLF